MVEIMTQYATKQKSNNVHLYMNYNPGFLDPLSDSDNIGLILKIHKHGVWCCLSWVLEGGVL